MSGQNATQREPKGGGARGLTDVAGSVLQDVRYAFRGLRREPGFSAAVVLTFGLALGANATMFGITDRLLLRAPAHVEDAERVVRIGFQQRSATTGLVTTSPWGSYYDFVDLRERVAGFAEVGVVGGTVDASLGVGADAELIRAAPASASFFRVLGVRPALGRFFTDDEDSPPQGSAVAVLGHDTWHDRFGGSPDVLGRTMELDGTVYTIVGVAPKGFNGIGLQPTAVWLPVTTFNTFSWEDWHLRVPDRVENWLQTVARLAEHATPSSAAAEATALLAGIYPEQYEADPDRGVVLGHIVAARSEGFSPASMQLAARVSVWLMAVAGIVLLIACANVASLLLGRSLRRRQELAVRLALGVGRGRLARQLFTEALLLAALGGLVGLLVSEWGGQLVRVVLLPGFEWQDSPASPRLLLFTLGALVLAAVVAALAPVALAARTGPASVLRAGDSHATGRGSQLRSALVVAQGALCVLLLVGAGLFVQSLRNVNAIDVGLAVNQLVYVNLPGGSPALYEQATERARALPYVDDAVLVAATLPFWSTTSRFGLQAEGLDSIPAPASGGPYVARVGPGYFSVAGTPIVRGRGIAEGDVEGAQLVTVISEGMSHLLWPGENPLGRCIEVSSSGCITVVGVAGNTRTAAIDGEPVIVYYLPIAQTEGLGHTLMVRMAAKGTAGLPLLRHEMQMLDPEMAAVRLRPLQELLEPQLRPWRLGAVLFTLFGTIALTLATLGLYAVIAYDVAQRRREMGIRLALGANPRHIVRRVLAGAGRLSTMGILLGLGAAALLAPRVEPMLLGIAPRSMPIYAAVGLLLVLVSLAAALLPAKRALRVEIAGVLRME
jgi:putative ABC transport system permease protein